MTVEEQKRMEALEAENAKLRGENSELQDRLLTAQKTLAKYAQMLFGQKTERVRAFQKSPRNSPAACLSRRWTLKSRLDLTRKQSVLQPSRTKLSM